MPKKTLIINDLHIPFQDKVAIELVLDFIRKKKLCRIILNGDIADCYEISRFDKNPIRTTNLQWELDEVRAFLINLRDLCPKAEIVYIQGNHEARLRKYLWNKGKEVASLRCLDFKELLGLASLRIDYYEEGYWLGKLYIYHGTLIRKDSGATAKAEFVKNGCSGISGHCHRDGKFGVRNQGGFFGWWENGCLCDLNPEYVEGVANWIQGFTMVTQIKGKEFVWPIAIINGTCAFGGRIHKLKG